jgi:hypothetical protein
MGSRRTAQAAKTTLFAAGSEADVLGKAPPGDFSPINSVAAGNEANVREKRRQATLGN